jgi:hypothetical protein
MAGGNKYEILEEPDDEGPPAKSAIDLEFEKHARKLEKKAKKEHKVREKVAEVGAATWSSMPSQPNACGCGWWVRVCGCVLVGVCVRVCSVLSCCKCGGCREYRPAS